MDRGDKDLLLHMAAIKVHCKQHPNCFGCRMELDPGHSVCFFQLGQCPSDWKDAVIAVPVEEAPSEEVEYRFRNHYKCNRCGTYWEERWDSLCDDRCPECNETTSPHYSEEILGKEDKP